MTEAPRVLSIGLFDRETGRPSARSLARHHIRHHYRVKSLRCSECVVHNRCQGLPIHMVRNQGLHAEMIGL